MYCALGSRQSQANALCYLGTLRRETGDYRRAVEAQEEALAIYRDLGSRLGQANAISTELAAVRRQTGDYGGAARYQEEALDLYRDLGDRGGQIMALCELGAIRRQTGDYQGAAVVLAEALAVSRELGDEAEALNELGELYRVRGALGPRQGSATSRPWIRPAGTRATATRRTRWPAWAAALWPRARPLTQRPALNEHWISTSGSAQPRRPRSPPKWTP